MRDKDATEMLRLLLPAMSVMVVTEPANARARPAAELAALARSLSPDSRIEVEPDPVAALERAWTHAPLICAAGSIFLIGDLLKGRDEELQRLITNLQSPAQATAITQTQAIHGLGGIGEPRRGGICRSVPLRRRP